jgi:hypothetical protein
MYTLRQCHTTVGCCILKIGFDIIIQQNHALYNKNNLNLHTARLRLL